MISQRNLLISWVVWHFYEMPKFLLDVWKNYIWFGADFFSVPLLVKTLFSPWRRYNWRYPKGFNLGEFFSTLISNIFSRAIGTIFRIILIIIGIATLIFILIFGAAVFLFWLLMPIIVAGLILFIFN